MHDLHVNFVISAALTDELLTEKIILFSSTCPQEMAVRNNRRWCAIRIIFVLCDTFEVVHTLLLINWTIEANNVFLVIKLAYKKNIQCSSREMQ